jgi:flagellar protein FlbD
MELKPDLTLTLLSGKTVVVSETPDQIVDRIVEYRKRIGNYSQEL